MFNHRLHRLHGFFGVVVLAGDPLGRSTGSTRLTGEDG
jgi:hypothetical protein